jgi:hypothetical protein
MKQCFKCKSVLPLEGFYKHPAMKDGRLNKCKACTKLDVFLHRQENLEKIRAYDRARGNRQSPDYAKEYRAKYPNKYKAHTIVGNAIRDGKLFPEPCCECGNPKANAHHDDYAKPLNVRWLCSACHSQWHSMFGEAKNPS